MILSKELYCDFDVYIAHWQQMFTHQTSMYSPLTFWYWSCHGTEACILVQKKLVSYVCRQEVTVCFMAVFVVNFLPSQVLLKVSREMEITGPHTVSRYRTVARGLNTSLYSFDRTPGDFHIFATIRSSQLAGRFATDSDIKQAVNWLQTLDTHFFNARTKALLNVGGYSSAPEASSINHQTAVLMSKNVCVSSDVGIQL